MTETNINANSLHERHHAFPVRKSFVRGGYITQLSGAYRNAGSKGYDQTHTSSISETDAVRYHFNSAYLYPSSSDNRAYAFSVRWL